MSKEMTNAQASLQGLADGDLTVLNVLTRMIEGTFEESGLDPKTFMLVRMAALATLEGDRTCGEHTVIRVVQIT